MPTICDTHALAFWGLEPGRLAPRALEIMQQGRRTGSLACADISFWELAMLFARGRLIPPVSPAEFMQTLVQDLRLTVLSITPEIAVLSKSDLFPHKDPADRLIAATAIVNHASLISADDNLHGLPGLRVIWD
ncbi:MAG: type II toxin-antitoxin system VapC family toxin [Gammaproteobacteria bacterium]